MESDADRSQIFKICSRTEWDAACIVGTYPGAPIDVKDGFIHFSAKHQVKETAAKHFAGQENLVLVRFETNQFGDDLKWEVSRGGDEFPHLYGELPTSAAQEVIDLPLQNGSHAFPEDLS